MALVVSAGVMATAALSVELVALSAASYVFLNRDNLPDLTALTAFDFPTIGHIDDRNGQSLIAFAREHRLIVHFADVPPILRDAVLAAEDKHFFTHGGVDYWCIPRLLSKIRLGAWIARLTPGGRRESTSGPAIFPQGGSTITQQLVRTEFLRELTSQENSYQLRETGIGPRLLSALVGARNANMAYRKREELRLSLWLETEMRRRFGSTRRAKEEIFARYASVVYMGHGQYGVGQAAEYYFGRPLSSFSAGDADRAAMLAGIAKSPREYAPDGRHSAPILRRRNQTLVLMAAADFISRDAMTAALKKPLPASRPTASPLVRTSGVVAHVLDELTAQHPELGVDDLLDGRIQVHTTVDARIQRIAAEALDRGLDRYEERRPRARGVTQGSVVVLKNSDGSILAEVGGRSRYQGKEASYSDFNRAAESLRQPGSTMKPMVYLAAFRSGTLTLDTLVPDEPISVPDGRVDGRKWIENYDGQFKGLIPARAALAESRNAVAMWIEEQIGIDSIIRTAQSLGVRTPLHRYATTALGASEVSLLELATAYRAIASGVLADPHLIDRIILRSGEILPGARNPPQEFPTDDGALALIQEGLRGVVRIPTGTAHALDCRAFPIAVMGKTGTTNDFRDALFVGSTYGPGGITVAVRIGFDDNRSLGPKETGGRVALPVFEELMLRTYGDRLAGPAPPFPPQMEQRITRYLSGDVLPAQAATSPSPPLPGCDGRDAPNCQTIMATELLLGPTGR